MPAGRACAGHTLRRHHRACPVIHDKVAASARVGRTPPTMLRMVPPPRNGEGGCTPDGPVPDTHPRCHHRAWPGDLRQGRRVGGAGRTPPTMLRMVPPPRNGEGGCTPDGPVPDTYSAVITGLAPVIHEKVAASARAGPCPVLHLSHGERSRAPASG